MSSHVVNPTTSTRWRSRTAVAATTPLEVRRRTLQVALGVIWLVDAALQFQPFMFTKAFVTSTLEPAASGSPWLLYQPMVWADHLMIHDIAWWNALYATLQLVIALGLFWRPTVRLALGTSIVWSLAVWWFAEGFGGLFAGGSPLAGQPGAVVLYAVIAILIWPTERDDASSVAAAGSWGRRGAIAVWVVLWVDFAVYFLTPANRAPQAMHDLVIGMASGEPGWVQSINHALAAVLAGRGLAFSLALALLSLVIALAVAKPTLVRPALIAAMAIAAMVWLVQDFGGLLTSQGTDVNSGPLIALLAWSFWPLSRSRRTTGQ
ncbi:MAG: hypothetical protein ACYDEH_01915 [Acidimicrobiales bacterium]